MNTVLVLIVLLNGAPNMDNMTYIPLDVGIDDCLALAIEYQKEDDVHAAFCIDNNQPIKEGYKI